MSQISQQKAQDISIELSKHLEEAAKEAAERFKTRVWEIYTDNVPKKVLDLFTTNGSYMHRTRQIKLVGNGFSHVDVTIKNYVPSATDYKQTFEPDPAEAKELTALFNWMEEAEARHVQLKLDIKTALLSLRSFKRIREQFPEAAKFLPEGNVATTAVCVDISKLRKKLA